MIRHKTENTPLPQGVPTGVVLVALKGTKAEKLSSVTIAVAVSASGLPHNDISATYTVAEAECSEIHLPPSPIALMAGVLGVAGKTVCLIWEELASANVNSVCD